MIVVNLFLLLVSTLTCQYLHQTVEVDKGLIEFANILVYFQIFLLIIEMIDQFYKIESESESESES